MPDIDRKFITYKSIEEVTREPGEGTWEILTDLWWSFDPSKGLLFYRKSPQCNSNKVIADKITTECHPGAVVVFVERAYLKHDCADYR